jgi:selenocysteine lyase/cysteine desulfurase
MLTHEFAPESTYLDTACYGLPPAAALSALADVTAAWAAGSYDPLSGDDAIARARAAFGRIVGVPSVEVAIGHQVSPMVGVVAASLRPGARVLAAEGEFTSLLFPFLAAGCRLETVPLAHLPAAIEHHTDVVAVSAVQSADGAVADLETIAGAAAEHAALTVIDATQACGWLPLDATSFDVVVCGAYKWLCNPRGTAFMTLSQSAREALVPVSAGWYAGPDPWETCYGTPLRLADDARRFDVSPAWFSWHAAAEALEVLEATGIERIHDHDLALANRLRVGLGLAPGDSAIVSFDGGADAAARLAQAGVRASVRAGRVRLSCHLYNGEADVDRALEALGTRVLSSTGS